ncbi:MAG TPA: hypothetical protein VLG91_07720, partial [Streptomyces sp.]|nr:hypothetical protein [Streptomyces sp.]
MLLMTEKMPAFRALVSFMDIREGDVSVMPLDATVQGWLDAGLVVQVGEAEILVEDTGPAEVTLSVG